jgi:intracellular sulfur oxidation DsrE/DsrF family protein
MKKHEQISEEQLNAFVDGELDPEEKSRLLNESNRSAELDSRLCQQRKLKELVKQAYTNVPPPRGAAKSQLAQSGLLGRALAASLLLVVGLSGGFFAHNYMDQASGKEGLTVATASQPVAAVENYILHVVSGEPEQMLFALEKARELLDSAEEGQSRQVEIVANERGLNLLRSDVTPYADRISALQDNDVVFYACSRTIERLEAKGVEVHLVPEANHAYTALDRVVIRMKDDWEYIKI